VELQLLPLNPRFYGGESFRITWRGAKFMVWNLEICYMRSSDESLLLPITPRVLDV
jgi:hypothetical protein